MALLITHSPLFTHLDQVAADIVTEVLSGRERFDDRL